MVGGVVGLGLEELGSEGVRGVGVGEVGVKMGCWGHGGNDPLNPSDPNPYFPDPNSPDPNFPNPNPP